MWEVSLGRSGCITMVVGVVGVGTNPEISTSKSFGNYSENYFDDSPFISFSISIND